MSGRDKPSTLARSQQTANTQFSTKKPEHAIQACTKKSWIEIQLVGEDGKPIPNERYKILFPDGSYKEGLLDSEGVAGYEELESENYEVFFPNLDQDAWEPLT